MNQGPISEHKKDIISASTYVLLAQGFLLLKQYQKRNNFAFHKLDQFLLTQQTSEKGDNDRARNTGKNSFPYAQEANYLFFTTNAFQTSSKSY